MIDLGKVKTEFKGEVVDGTTYEKFNMVSQNGMIYTLLVNSTTFSSSHKLHRMSIWQPLIPMKISPIEWHESKADPHPKYSSPDELGVTFKPKTLYYLDSVASGEKLILPVSAISTQAITGLSLDYIRYKDTHGNTFTLPYKNNTFIEITPIGVDGSVHNFYIAFGDNSGTYGYNKYTVTIDNSRVTTILSDIPSVVSKDFMKSLYIKYPLLGGSPVCKVLYKTSENINMTTTNLSYDPTNIYDLTSMITVKPFSVMYLRFSVSELKRYNYSKLYRTFISSLTPNFSFVPSHVVRYWGEKYPDYTNITKFVNIRNLTSDVNNVYIAVNTNKLILMVINESGKIVHEIGATSYISYSDFYVRDAIYDPTSDSIQCVFYGTSSTNSYVIVWKHLNGNEWRLEYNTKLNIVTGGRYLATETTTTGFNAYIFNSNILYKRKFVGTTIDGINRNMVHDTSIEHPTSNIVINVHNIVPTEYNELIIVPLKNNSYKTIYIVSSEDQTFGNEVQTIDIDCRQIVDLMMIGNNSEYFTVLASDHFVDPESGSKYDSVLLFKKTDSGYSKVYTLSMGNLYSYSGIQNISRTQTRNNIYTFTRSSIKNFVYVNKELDILEPISDMTLGSSDDREGILDLGGNKYYHLNTDFNFIFSMTTSTQKGLSVTIGK